MRAMSLKIVADDLGISEPVNQATRLAFESGLISAASMMPNMPFFRPAVEMVKDLGLERSTGIHLNLTEGEPLTRTILQSSRFAAGGRFVPWRGRTEVWSLTSLEKSGVVGEWRAQIEQALQHGIGISHLDSHHHAHNSWPLGHIIISLAKEYDIPFVRISRNCNVRRSFALGAYKVAFNSRLRAKGVAGSEFFGSAEDILAASKFSPGANLEVMVHPLLNDEGVILDATDGQPLQESVEQLRARLSFLNANGAVPR